MTMRRSSRRPKTRGVAGSGGPARPPLSGSNGLLAAGGTSTRVALRDDLRKWFNEFIRLRDWPFCYTCGRDVSGQAKEIGPKYVAGHFIPKNVCGDILEFDERNVHGQCQRCNRHLHGNLSFYALQLVREYGGSIFEDLFAIYGGKSDDWTLKIKRDNYRRAVLEYRAALKHAKENADG